MVTNEFAKYRAEEDLAFRACEDAIARAFKLKNADLMSAAAYHELVNDERARYEHIKKDLYWKARQADAFDSLDGYSYIEDEI